MKAIRRFFATILFFFLLLFGLAAQPCVSVNFDITSCASSTGVPLVPSNYLLYDVIGTAGTLNLNPGARYKAFWMLGDGNMRYFPDSDSLGDVSTYNLGYRYRSESGPIGPGVILVEKKSNTDPPPDLFRSFDLPSPTLPPTSADSFHRRIFNAVSMDIFNHERNRPHYPTVFAVSGRSEDYRIDTVYFFYNSVKNPSGSYGARSIHDSLHFVHLPNYYPSGLSFVEYPISSLPTHIDSGLRSFLARRFNNFIVVPVPLSAFAGGKDKYGFTGKRAAFRSVAQNTFDEFRIFPALRTMWDTTWVTTGDTTLPIGHYLSLAIGGSNMAQDGSMPSSVAAQLASDVQSYFGTNNLSFGGGKFIRGISSTDVSMVAAIDPNGLTIEQICPLGNNRYKVRIKMEVCNEGYMHTDSFRVDIIDHTGFISKPVFDNTDKLVSLPPASISAVGDVWSYRWDEFLDGVPLPENSGLKEQVETCVNKYFTVETNWTGVQKLAEGKGLELCVTFKETGVQDCRKNYALTGRTVNPLTGYNCGEVLAKDNCCCAIYIILALSIIILLLLIWVLWLLYRRR